MLTVYKASAGSGKTFQLVVEYLKLLMKNPYNYKHILAVTFTNKATNEMKSRILEQLNLLAGNNESKYLETLQKELSFSEETIRKKSKQVLKNILHDYNRFSINTIDSFTQRIIKSFNRELGISPNFALELDSSMVLEESVDRLLSKIDQDKNLLKWLIKFSEEKITENQSQRIEEDIKSLGKELFNEKFQLFFPEQKDSGYTRENLNSFRKKLNKIIFLFESTLKKKGLEAVKIMETSQLDINDFSGKGRGMGAFFVKLSQGDQPNITKTVETASIEVEKWYTKSSIKKEIVHTVVENQLQPLLQEILSFYRNESTQYFSAIAVNNQIRMLGILTDLKEEIKTMLHEKGVLQISDSNLLLSKIIGESESPFIYEKIGNFYKYFMLDEFQDTSALQWKNFKPLIANSLSEGNNNLLVGDVKQSIYRWRNSDWNILAKEVDTDFPNFYPETKTLDKNWRSDKNIIDFNNAIIRNLKSVFENTLFENSEDPDWQFYKEKFSNVYSDFFQEKGMESDDKKGWVKINFLEKEGFVKNSIDLLVNQVKQLQDNGLKASEIAILIRKNKEGTKVIEEFLAAAKQEENSKYNLNVLSNESLFLHASKAVLFVIYLIELLIDPEDKITKTALLQLWKGALKPEIEKSGISFSAGSETQMILDFSAKQKEEWQPEKDSELEFEKELGQKFNEIKQKVLLTSLDETIIEICSHFHLLKIENELPFLQTLIDKAGEIKISISNDLSNFLHWWSEKGFKNSVNVNDEVDSIRMLTVHKSKGLEFKAVLVPFLNWETSPSGNLAPILWCKSEKEPFNQFPLLPVKSAEKLLNTFYKKDFLEEKTNTFIDTLNLIYVAFTRAESVLFLNTIDSDKPGKNVNSLLKQSLQLMSSEKAFTECWNKENTIFEFGQQTQFQTVESPSNLVLIKKYEFNNFKSKIRLRLNGDEFLIPGEKDKSIKNIGKLIHEILSDIETKNDVKKACLKAFHEGRIDEKELSNIQNELQKSLEKPEVKSWFDGSFRIINERNLLTSEKILRPDRIMVSGENAIVVDYKIGEKKSDSYNRQVNRYAKTLKETGFKKVEGYLWYVVLNEVEKVGEY